MKEREEIDRRREDRMRGKGGWGIERGIEYFPSLCILYIQYFSGQPLQAFKTSLPGPTAATKAGPNDGSQQCLKPGYNSLQ